MCLDWHISIPYHLEDDGWVFIKKWLQNARTRQASARVAPCLRIEQAAPPAIGENGSPRPRTP